MSRKKLYVLVLVLLAAPFYLNDFSSIFIKNWVLWLGIDYVGLKLFPFLVVCWLIKNKKMELKEFGITPQPRLQFLIVFACAALLGTLIDQNAYKLLESLPGYSALGGMPMIKSPVWNWIDLTFGLLMVGVFEELVFRGYLHTFIHRYTKNPLLPVVASAIAFGLIHWSGGLHGVLITGAIGAIFMIAYMVTRSLPAIMLAHFTVNFIDFAGVIPKSIFKLIG